MKWLGRSVIQSPYLTFCDSEKEFKQVVKHLKYSTPVPDWCGDGGKMHTFEKSGSMPTCVVCVTPDIYKRELGSAIGLLIHEAVHVYQAMLSYMRESHPSKEFEAYSVQTISQQLIWEFLRRRKRKALVRVIAGDG